MIYEEYIQELISGNQIRIKYKTPNYDYCEEEGWWSEELWCYDCETKQFKCYYPVSSYEKDFFTTHIQKDVENCMKECIKDLGNICDSSSVESINIETNDNQSNSLLSVQEIAIERIKGMSDEDIRKMLSL